MLKLKQNTHYKTKGFLAHITTPGGRKETLLVEAVTGKEAAELALPYIKKDKRHPYRHLRKLERIFF